MPTRVAPSNPDSWVCTDTPNRQSQFHTDLLEWSGSYRQEGGVVNQICKVGVAGVCRQIGGAELGLETDAVWQCDIVQKVHTPGGVRGVGGEHTVLQVVGQWR